MRLRPKNANDAGIHLPFCRPGSYQESRTEAVKTRKLGLAHRLLDQKPENRVGTIDRISKNFRGQI